jgi:hypothetical protein
MCPTHLISLYSTKISSYSIEFIEMTGKCGRRRKHLLDDLKILEIERGSTRSHSMENSLWKRLWTCHKTDYRMNE